MPNNEKTCFQKKSEKAGFTLIEVAVVLVIVGIIISIMSTILPTLIQSSKISKCRAIMEKFDYSMEGYIAANGRCPCPDTDGDGLENRNPGSNPPTDDTCAAYVGDLPYLSVGLSSGEDNWHNSITYAVYEDFIKTTPSGLCSSLSSFIQNPNTNWLRTTANGNSTNQAYALVSGGPKDLDGVNGFFDGLNGSSPNVEFEIPDKIMDANYDDLLRATSFAYLQGKQCGSGGAGGGGNCDGVESVFCGNCDDTIDNDNDGLTDCIDTDCATHPECANPVCNIATASPLPSGTINSDYSVTLTASNGCIGPLEWELLNNGGFNDFYLHPYTGFLTGKLSKCTGSHTITIGLTDSDTDNDPDPQKPFTIEVVANLSVARTSGDGSTTITWDTPTRQETFKANGGHVGEIEWSLNTGGATGFAFVSTGEDTCTIKKDGTTTASTYTFTLTGTDMDCSGNTANLVLTVTVTEDGTGTPYTEGMEAEWRFDECTEWSGSNFDVVNSLGEINHYGRAMGGITAVYSGKNCRAASFDGGDDKIVSAVLTGDDIMAFNDEVTLACWFKSPGGGGTYPRLIEFSDAAGNSNWSTALAYDPDGSLRAWVTDASGGGRGGTIDYSTELYNDNQWHHVVYTYSSTDGGNLYVDGVLKSTNTDNLTSDIYDAETFVIGGYYPNTSNGFNGLIDEVMVFNQELTADEASEIFNLTRSSCSGACYTDPIAEYRMDEFSWSTLSVEDSSGNGHHGEGYYNADTTADGKLCRGGLFTDSGDNNINDRVKLPYEVANNLQDFVIAAWMKTSKAGEQAILSGANNGQNNEFLIFLPNASIISTYCKGAYNSYNAPSSLSDDSWHHIVWMREGDQEWVYLDGASLGNEIVTSSAVNISENGLWLASEQDSVGGGWASEQEFVGTIDEVYFFDRALSENEIKANMNETRTCPEEKVTITTTGLNDATINSPYSYTISALQGSLPYGWEIVSSDIPGLTITPNTGELNGTIDVCAGDHDITLRVTDSGGDTDERLFTLTVKNGTLIVSPSAPRTFNCTTVDFYRDFSVSGPRRGALENWAVTWLGTNPGGFDVVKTGDTTVRFRKIGTSVANNGFLFKLTANDGTCMDNPVDSGYYTLNISGSGAGAPYYSGRVGEWWLDDLSGPIIDDHSGQNNNGTASGGVTYGIQGKIWTALEFDGSSGYVNCGNNAILDISTGDFTVGAWVKLPTIPVDGFFVDKGTGNLFDGYGLAIIGGKFAFVTDGDGGSGGKVTLTAADNAVGDTWYHVVGVRVGGVKTLYINKVAEPTQTDARDLSDTSQPLYIGRAVNDSDYFQGTIDEVVVYNRGLSQSEITDFYNQASLVAYYPMDETQGDIYDYSGQGNHGTNNGASYGAAGKVGYGLEFDGSDDVTIVNNEALSPESITLSAWVKASAIDDWNGIITNIDTTSPRHGLNLQVGTSQDIASLIYDGAGGGGYINSTTVPAVDTWYHVVLTHNSPDNRSIFYVNGNNERETTAYGLAYLSGTDTIIGRFYTDSTGLRFKGIIDEVRIYNRALSDDEVKNLYHKGLEEGG